MTGLLPGCGSHVLRALGSEISLAQFPRTEKVLSLVPGQPDALRYLAETFSASEQWDSLVALYEDQLRAGGVTSRRRARGARSDRHGSLAHARGQSGGGATFRACSSRQPDPRRNAELLA